jgi:hypothetical protein
MKIGILLTAYDCEKYIARCLKPWLELRKSHDIVIACNSGMFSPYLDFGFAENNDGTLKVLTSSELNFLITTTGANLLNEESSRNYCLDYLNKQNVDIVWGVDADEIYTEQEILDIIDFISEHPDRHTFKVQYKNYTFRYPYYTKGFDKECIYRTNVDGGISHFHFDNYITYQSGRTNSQVGPPLFIPKDIAYIDHFSWMSDDQRSFEKIVYQESRFDGPEGARCGYKSGGGELTFNEAYWQHRSIDLPMLSVQNVPFTFDLELTYSREKRCLFVDEIQREMEIVVKVFNARDRERISTFEMSVVPGVRYWVAPPDAFFGGGELEGLYVEAWESGNLIHNEELWTKPQL